jgi:hypothetical protein
MIRKQHIIITVALSVLFGACTHQPQNPQDQADSPTDQLQPETTSGLITKDNDIVVNTQPPGSEVIISMIILASPGFVAIHPVGSSDAIIGTTSLMQAGQNQDVPVPLTTPTVSGSDYIATLYFDDGNAAFALPEDTSVTGEDGTPISMQFTVSATASAAPAAGVSL